jgi:hypothetical protein
MCQKTRLYSQRLAPFKKHGQARVCALLRISDVCHPVVQEQGQDPREGHGKGQSREGKVRSPGMVPGPVPGMGKARSGSS